ncbi:unnamed protein product [Didymodactylos carnosus]|uniref:Uncharacterized protein n=1 Tax=Didymodactylos carnosus TaxID=1234261 RepID=A0A814FYK3_9BILA|nr:unnamed protein product [Didymodactylos carnosus]CAF0991160.1 unnamed protein product [Didymodactylos carnosus]CAF3506694.1 unnamed protein product [Didymodactylos carnosus]CAF3763105.1 unnamed protein product [Didymodactylos carnosus]
MALTPPAENDQRIVIPDDLSDEIIDDELLSSELENKEVIVSTLLEDQISSLIPESYRIPSYQLDWHFIDKNTIRVTFRLYSFPRQTDQNRLISSPSTTIIKTRKGKTTTTSTTTSTPPLSSIHYLKYYVFVIKHYKTMKERALGIEPLVIVPKNQSIKQSEFIFTTLRLTALNKKEKYSVCLCYYQTNSTEQTPDFLLCQDIINDYSKFGHPKSNHHNELFFIVTQYSIIIALLIALQGVYTMRKRRITHILHQHLTQKAHMFRHTISSISLGRQSFSSLDTAASGADHQHNHHRNGNNSSSIHKASHALDEFYKLQNVLREPTINEELTPPPDIVISNDEPEETVEKSDFIRGSSPDENEPFLKHYSKNYVHFRLDDGTSDASDEDNEEKKLEHHPHTNFLHSKEERIPAEDNENTSPYNEQSDAVQCMKHILDTAKLWTTAKIPTISEKL